MINITFNLNANARPNAHPNAHPNANPNANSNIKLNEELFLNSIKKMDNHNHYFAMYVRQEMSKGTSEFHSTIKFLMDENVPQKYKDIYRKKQNQVIESMDLDEAPDPPKLVRSNAKSYY